MFTYFITQTTSLFIFGHFFLSIDRIWETQGFWRYDPNTLCCSLNILSWGNDINKLREQHIILRERHKQTFISIPTQASVEVRLISRTIVSLPRAMISLKYTHISSPSLYHHKSYARVLIVVIISLNIYKALLLNLKRKQNIWRVATYQYTRYWSNR